MKKGKRKINEERNKGFQKRKATMNEQKKNRWKNRRKSCNKEGRYQEKEEGGRDGGQRKELIKKRWMGIRKEDMKVRMEE